MLRRSVCLAALAVLLAAAAFAQETRGHLVGRITDSSGAVIPGGTVEARNAATGVVSKTASNAEGLYQIRYLLSGLYTVTASAPGFKTLVREGVEVRVDDRLEVNFAMAVGVIEERIQVTGSTPLLESATASVGQVTDQKRLAALPLMHGNPMSAVELTPGLAQVRTSNLGVWGGRPYDNSWTTSFTIDGAQPNTAEISMDGIPNTTTLGGSKSGGYQTVAYTPPNDLVQEVKVQTASFDASTGYTTGSTINFSVKSGTNRLHGTASLHRMWPGTNANSWFSNRNRLSMTDFSYKRWDGTATGPVRIPHLYDGRNRTFFSYGYGGQHDSTPYGSNLTVPTAAQLGGDFSALLKIGTNYQIYDPATARLLSTGRVQRDPLAGNIVPASRISSFTKNLSQYWAAPAATGTVDGGTNLPEPNLPDPNRYYSHLVRIDQTVSQSNRLFGRVAFSKNIEELFNDYYHTQASGVDLMRRSRTLALDDVHVFGPAIVLNVRYGYTRFIEERFTPKSLGVSPTAFGFDAGLASQIDPHGYVFPTITVSGYSTLGNENPSHNVSDIHTANISVDHLMRTHSLKTGVDVRAYRTYSHSYGQAVPAMAFDNTYTLGPSDTSSSAPRGQALAAFLLGVPTTTSIARNDSSANQSVGIAPYIQDDWKVRRNLLVTIGLRWEYEGPVTERFNRSTRGYDFTTASPYEAAARANYALSPSAALPLSQFHPTGGLLYAGVNGTPRQLYDRDNKVFAPRVGLAWTANSKTVVRAGFGLFYTGNGARVIGASQNGFSRTTSTSNSLDGGLTFRMTNLANPFVDGILAPVGSSLGLSTDAGNSVTFTNPLELTPYTARWQASVQRQLPSRVLLDVAYIGNRSTHQRISRNLDALPNQYLSRLTVRDQANYDYLSTRVNNPFYPLLPGTSLAGSVTTLSQLLTAYPQYTGLTTASPQGYSWYHSLQIKMERRFAQSFTLQGSFTQSKLMQASSFLNAGDLMPERVISSIDFPQRVSLSGIYEFPFGHGRWLGHAPSPVRRIIEGWQLQGFFTGQSGDALGFGNSFFYGDLKNIALPNNKRTVDRWFNVDAGFERASAKQPVANLNLLSSRFSCVRADGINQLNFSAIKNTTLRENLQLQLRVEAINALNHAMFADPNTSPSSSSFGYVTSEKGSPRSLMFGMKLQF
jgi:hypothetical protein